MFVSLMDFLYQRTGRWFKMGKSFMVGDPKFNKIVSMIEDEFFYGKFLPTHKLGSACEGYAFMLKELDALWASVKGDNINHAIDRAIRVAAMAIRFVYDARQIDDVCPRCNGLGTISGEDDEPCPRCGGHGIIKHGVAYKFGDD